MELAPLETEVIDLFVRFARLLSIPKSVAEIYGLLFIAPNPLDMEDIIHRLRLSKGSASQGLRTLRRLGAVKAVYVSGKRNDHYEAELELRKLVGGLLKDKVSPHFDSGSEYLGRIEGIVEQMPDGERDVIAARVEKLKSWQKSAGRFLPLLQKLLA